MNIAKQDLNLLVYLDVLLREKNVSRAANRLNITQPAMSNGLKRLRTMFNDPLLVRTTKGMEPTEKALSLQPVIHQILMDLEVTLQNNQDFNPADEKRLFRLMASDYAATTLIPKLMESVYEQAPDVVLDLMTPSDVTFADIEDGKVDFAINVFEDLPQSFHKKDLWQDRYCCLVRKDNPALGNFDLESYLAADHVWAGKTGYGVGVGIDMDSLQKLSWLDRHLASTGGARKIKAFTRDYHIAVNLAEQLNLIVTLPTMAAQAYNTNEQLVIIDTPFELPPVTLQMVWSPLLHHDHGHKWLRSQINKVVGLVKKSLG